MFKKVLFLYPNIESEIRIPLAISILMKYAEKLGCKIELFDTTFMTENNRKDDHLQEQIGVLKKTNVDEMIGKIENIDIMAEWSKKLVDFKPDLIACSLLERNFVYADSFLSVAKEILPDVKISVGGILPTIAPYFVMDNMPYVDMVCVGEGEKAFVEQVMGQYDPLNTFVNFENKWYKPIRFSPLIDLNFLYYQEWKFFDKRHMLKPLDGKVYKGGSFEFSRGCARSCSFCVAPVLRKKQRSLGSMYIRRKSPERMISEIKYYKDIYGINLVSFCDVGFFNRFNERDKNKFAEMYVREVDLPYVIQASAPFLAKEKNVKFLKQTGCISASIGVESGNKRIRCEIMNKPISDETIKSAFNNMSKYNVRSTANFMIGLPTETEIEINDTIDFCKEIKPDSIAVTYFVPFLGTQLYDVCVKQGLYKFDPWADVYEGSPMSMPQISNNKLKSLMLKFIDEFNGMSND